MKLIKSANGCINPFYDICAQNIDDIYRANRDPYSMICDGFCFGYMQGMKAAKKNKYI